MKTIRLLKRDLLAGLYYNGVFFLVPVVVSVAQCLECQNLIASMMEEELIESKGTVFDYLLYCTRGMIVFHFDPKEYFSIPIFWFVFQIFLSYIIGYYAYEDFKENGRGIFLAVGNRTSWWNGKCLWCLCCVIFYFALYYLSTILFAILCGAQCRVDGDKDFLVMIFGRDIGNFTVGNLLLIAVFLPFVITFGLCMIQIFAGFLLTPVVSFANMCGVYVLSAYYTIWFLPGNFTMWLRSSYVTAEGVRPISGVLLGILLSIFSWYAGKQYFLTKDIL